MAGESYGRFASALLADDLEAAEAYLNDVLVGCISSFDGGARAYARTLEESGIAPERIREVGLAFSSKEALIG